MAKAPYEWKNVGNISLSANADDPHGLYSNGTSAKIIFDRPALLNIVELVQLASQPTHDADDLNLMQQLARDTDTFISEGLGEETSRMINTHAKQQRQAREVFDNAADRLEDLDQELKNEGHERVKKLEQEMEKLTRKMKCAKSLEQNGDHWVNNMRGELRSVQCYASLKTLDETEKAVASIEKNARDWAKHAREKRKRDDAEDAAGNNKRARYFQID